MMVFRPWPVSGDIAQQFLAGGVHLHAHGVDTACPVQRALGGRLVHVVLVLPRRWNSVDLHQLRSGSISRRAMETEPYVTSWSGNSRAGNLGRRVDGGPALVHQHDGDGAGEAKPRTNACGLTAGVRLADGHRLDLEAGAEGADRLAASSRCRSEPST